MNANGSLAREARTTVSSVSTKGSARSRNGRGTSGRRANAIVNVSR